MPENNANKYGVTSAWGGDVFYDLTLPSEQVVQMRHLQLEDIAKLDLVEIMATFSFLAEDPKPKGKKKVTTEEQEREQGRRLFERPERLAKILETANKVVSMAVSQPKVELPPENPTDRVDGAVYTDTVPFPDKMFIFNQVMDSVGGMESFRAEPTADVGNLEDGQGVQQPAL